MVGSPVLRGNSGWTSKALCRIGLVIMLMFIIAGHSQADSLDNQIPESRTKGQSEPYRGIGDIVYAKDIKAAMHRHLDNVIDKAGLFGIVDDVTAQALALRFVQIHDPVRQIGDDVYFACTDFHVDGTPEKIYDIDFWLRVDQGELKVFQTKIHKEPRRSLLYGWYKHPRYTFVNDEIEYLYSD